MLSNPSGYRRLLPSQRLCYYFVGIFLCLEALSGALAQEVGDGSRDPDTLYEAGAYRQALDIWMVLAFEGDPQSQFRVGVLFSEGKGVDQDLEQSAYWYTQAARQGHVAAQYNLGHAYYAGAGIKQSNARALEWWEAAARGGHALAQYNAGRAYYMGTASTKDPQAARFWFSQAAANGEPRSQDILDRLGWEPVAAVHLAQPTEPEPETPEATTENLPDPAPPQNIVTNTVNQDLQPPATSLSADNPDGPPPGEHAPAKPTVVVQPEARTAPPDSVGEPVTPPVPADEPAAIGEKPTLLVNKRSAPDDGTNRATATQPVVAPSVGTDVDSPGTIAVYSIPGTGGLLLGVVDEAADWRIISRQGAWLRVTRTPGFPVWIHRDHVTLNGSTAITTGNRVNLRAAPVVHETSMMGVIQSGENLNVLSRQGDWVRVISPTNIAAWIREQDINTKALGVSAPGTGNTSGWRTVGGGGPGKGHIKNDESWLFSQPPAWFTIQIISLASENGIIDFIRNLELGDNARYYTTIVNDSLWYVLRYGSYPTYEEANDASSTLPVAGQTIWIRNIGIIQRDRCQSIDGVPDNVRSGLEPWCN
jgi:hypothetical protein